VSTTFRHDPARIRRWAAGHGIEVADAPEAGPGSEPEAGPASEPEAGPGSEPEAGPGSEPGSEPEAGLAGQLHFGEYQRPDRARAELARLTRDARFAQLAQERDAGLLERRIARLRREAGEYEALIADRKAEAAALASQVARLTHETDQAEQRARATRASAARQAAEDARAAALARRVVQVLEDDKPLDPFTAALAALAQQKRRLSEIAAEDDLRLAALAEAIQAAAERRARVAQLQVRQITVNKNHGPDSAEAAAVRRELAAERLAMAVLATLGSGLDGDDVVSVALTGALGDGAARPPRLLTDPDWPVTA
jgi:hypothetical protein